MAVAVFTMYDYNLTNAEFRAWGSALSAAFSTAGLVQVSTSAGGDTGQINWTTVAAPANNTFAGYELWQFNDTLQSTAPVTMKIQYGTGSNNGNVISIAVGSSYNNASNNGTLTGVISSTYTIGTNVGLPGSGTATGSIYTCYVSSDTSRCQCVMRVSNIANGNVQANGSWGFSLTRLVDSNGNYVNWGTELFTLEGSQSGASHHVFIPSLNLGYGNAAIQFTTPENAAPSSGFGSYQNNVAVYPLFTPIGLSSYPAMGVCGCFLNDMAIGGASLTLNFYGQNHNFMIVRSDGTGGTGAANMKQNANTNTSAWAFRME